MNVINQRRAHSNIYTHTHVLTTTSATFRCGLLICTNTQTLGYVSLNSGEQINKVIFKSLRTVNTRTHTANTKHTWWHRHTTSKHARLSEVRVHLQYQEESKRHRGGKLHTLIDSTFSFDFSNSRIKRSCEEPYEFFDVYMNRPCTSLLKLPNARPAHPRRRP